jgi:hypothetical protein
MWSKLLYNLAGAAIVGAGAAYSTGGAAGADWKTLGIGALGTVLANLAGLFQAPPAATPPKP